MKCKCCKREYNESEFDYNGYCSLYHKMVSTMPNEIFNYRAELNKLTPMQALNEIKCTTLTVNCVERLLLIAMSNKNCIDEMIKDNIYPEKLWG